MSVGLLNEIKMTNRIWERICTVTYKLNTLYSSLISQNVQHPCMRGMCEILALSIQLLYSN